MRHVRTAKRLTYDTSEITHAECIPLRRSIGLGLYRGYC
jgi:hypothetical protein